MVRIPRAEVTVEPRIAAQPDLAGSGWGAPGAAMQKLGQGISALGEGLAGMAGNMDAAAQKEQGFQDQLTMLKTDNSIGLANIEAQKTYTGNGDDYLEQRSTFYDDTTAKALEIISPQNQPKAQIFFEQRRGPALEEAAKYGGKLRQDSLINQINETTATEFGKLADVPPEELDAKLDTTLKGVNAIIAASPLPDDLKNEAASNAADNAINLMQGIEDPDQVQEIVPRVMRLIESADPAKQPAQELRDVGPETLGDQGPQGQAQQLQPPPGTVINGQDGQPGIAPSGQQGLRQPGAPGSQSGLGQQGQPQAQPQFGQINFKDFSSGRVSGRPLSNPKYIILHDVSGDPKTRRLPSGGNIPNYHITVDDNGVYQEVPFNRQAPHARAYNKNSIGIASIGFEGDKTSPQRIANLAYAVKTVADQFGIPPENILTHPGAGRMATKSGKDPKEASWLPQVLAYIQNGPQPGQPQPQNVAQNGPQRAPGTIPTGQEGQDLKGRSLTAQAGLEGQGGREVKVADASGRFVPQQVAYRSVQSHLRDKLIQKLPQFRAQALRAESQREKAEEAMVKEEADAAMVEGVKLDATGGLTLEWIKANEPRLGPDKTTQLLRAYKSGDNILPLEPEQHLELLKTLDADPETGLKQATQLFLERRITRSQFDDINRQVQREMNPETRLPQYAKDWNGEVREQVATHQGDTWDRIERSQRAMQDYADQMSSLQRAGKLTPEIAGKRAKEVIDNFKFRKAREDRSSLPLPQKYSKATAETMNFDELAAAEAKLAADYQAQAAPLANNPAALTALRAKFAQDAKILKSWRHVLSTEAAAKGEKIPPQVPPASAQPAKPGEGKPGEGKDATGKDAKPAEKKPQAMRKRIERDAGGNMTGLVEEPITDETDGGQGAGPFPAE